MHRAHFHYTNFSDLLAFLCFCEGVHCGADSHCPDVCEFLLHVRNIWSNLWPVLVWQLFIRDRSKAGTCFCVASRPCCSLLRLINVFFLVWDTEIFGREIGSGLLASCRCIGLHLRHVGIIVNNYECRWVSGGASVQGCSFPFFFLSACYTVLGSALRVTPCCYRAQSPYIYAFVVLYFFQYLFPVTSYFF